MIWRSPGFGPTPASRVPPSLRKGGDAMEQSTAPDRSGADVPEQAHAAAGRESDLADIATLPLAAVDDLTPLRPTARLLDEVLRARSSMRGGNEGPARAE
jgi:hypothetical protein